MPNALPPSLAHPPLKLLRDAALFLDFDGTLVPLTDVPEAVTVDRELHLILEQACAALGGRLAIISGRSVSVLRDLFGLEKYLLSGSHGLEFARPGEAVVAPVRSAGVDEAETVMLAFVADKPGLLVERKTLSVALHFRQSPQWVSQCRNLATDLAMRTGLLLQTGKMVFELRPGGANKGTAIAAMMREAPMAGGIPLFIGDDVTDEDGFEAANALGGHGILVGPPRVTAAHWILEQVGAVRHYLTKGAAWMP